MTKRLRKKLRLREFQEMGFLVKFDLDISNTQAAEFAFSDKLIEMIEANQLHIGGGITDFFACAGQRRTATGAHREAVRQWLQEQPEITAINVGPLVDAWHGPF
ncbi:hypothetical protein A0257_19050 [Hymenobacter psoromatis]|nr:hypothetical protein A0257_19050 [Hymenobacter psoromatis]